jgi:hypothetical protein
LDPPSRAMRCGAQPPFAVQRPNGERRTPDTRPSAPRYSQQTQNDLGGADRRDASSRRLGLGIKPSRWACFLAALRARRMASAFSRVLRSDGFSYALRRFISRKTPSRCIFFLRTLRGVGRAAASSIRTKQKAKSSHRLRRPELGPSIATSSLPTPLLFC